MDFSKNIKAFLGTLPPNLKGGEKFLAVAAHCSSGSMAEVRLKDVSVVWPRAILKIKYHASYYSDAQTAGWVDSIAPGTFQVTEEGFQHLNDLAGTAGPGTQPGSSLYIFNRKSPHSFDKFLRGILTTATAEVLLADSYVDETIFDTVLDSVGNQTLIRLIYGKAVNSYSARAARFRKQYPRFTDKNYSKLHDRFLIVDSAGYIIGPSIKDAADKSPALIVKLNQRDSKLLTNFFSGLWTTSV